MKRLGERTVRLDCDVIQADGGTRTASITGAVVALRDALDNVGAQAAFREFAASVSVGIWRGVPVLDLDYAEDSSADTDMNVVMLASGRFRGDSRHGGEGALRRGRVLRDAQAGPAGGRRTSSRAAKDGLRVGNAGTQADFVASMIRQGVLRFGDFELKSGLRSPYFFNLGNVSGGCGN